MDLGVILLIVLLVLAIGGLPTWGYHRYGYRPSGLVGIILILVLVMVLMGQI